MNRIKWFFMSKYKKLLYQIECAESNKQRLHLNNGLVLDFTDGTLYREHDCWECENHGTDDCPTSSKCLALKNKPFFKKGVN